MRDESKDIEIQDPGLEETAAEIVHIEGAEARPRPPVGIRAGKLAGLTMWQAIWVLSWPILASSFLQSLVGLVDTSLAAGISEAATDAIGVAAYFMWLINLVGMALGVGATALVSRSVAKGRLAFAGAALGQGILAAGVMGIVMTAILMAVAPFIAGALTNSEEATQLAALYLRITACGIPAITVLLVGTAALRASGDSFKPLLIMIFVNAVNMLTSFACAGIDWKVSSLSEAGEVQEKLILSNPFPFELGIAGVAIGTLIAWLTGATAILVILAKGSHGLRLRASRMRYQAKTMWRLVRVGLPNGFETLALWFGNLAIISLVNLMNIPGMLGVHVVAVRIEAFSFLPGFAMGMAAATLAGQHIGAGQPELARKATIRCASIGTLIMLGFGIAFFTIPEQIVGVFSRQQMHLELTPQLLRVCALIQIPFAIVLVVRSVLRGVGDTKVVLALTLTSTYLIRIPLAWLFSGIDLNIGETFTLENPAPLSGLNLPPIVGVWIGLCSEIAIRCVLFLARFASGKWEKLKV